MSIGIYKQVKLYKQVLKKNLNFFIYAYSSECFVVIGYPRSRAFQNILKLKNKCLGPKLCVGPKLLSFFAII